MPSAKQADTVARFVPAALVKYLLPDANQPISARKRVLDGVVLFADISGFSRLADRLSRRHDGAERISEALDTHLGGLVAQIAAHGGDVLSFAGDAVVAIWECRGEPGATDYSAGMAMAASCAFRSQELIAAGGARDGSQLSMRICIGVGPIELGVVGGMLDRWQLLLTGSPLAEFGALKAFAAPGETVLSRRAASWLGGDCQLRPLGAAGLGAAAIRLESVRSLEPLRPPTPVPPLDRHAVESVLQFLPGAIVTRLKADASALTGELRRVSSVFVKLPIPLDQTLDLEEACEVVTAIQRAIYRYDGSVDKICVDEKGLVLVACFGLPPLSHADDPLRSVQAALQIRANVHELGKDCSVGVSTGQVFAGTVGGNDARAEYTVLGSAVNLAARLMEAAAGQILVDQTTLAGSTNLLEFTPPVSLQIKGSDGLVDAFSPTGVVKAIVRQRTELVGRTGERECMSSCMQALVRASESSNVVLIGEAGIGKTRILDDLEGAANRLGIKVLRGSGDALETQVSYRVWSEILATCFGWRPRDDLARKRQKVLDFLASQPDLVQRLPLLNAVLPLDLPENEVTQSLSGEGRAFRTRELLVAILALHASQYQTLIVLEDAHWMDSTSWEVLREARRAVNPAMFVLATRPVELPIAFENLCQEPNTHVLRIRPLSREDVGQLASQRMGVRSLPPEVVDLIHMRAGGNALFVEELALVLRDRNLLTLTGEDAQLAVPLQQLSRVELPATVGGVIVSRLDKLPMDQQMTLKVAAVLGQQFPVAAVQDLYPAADTQVDVAAMLPSLMEQDLVRRSDSAGQFEFKHALAQEAIYGLMLFAQRRQLHKRAAEWFERRHEDDSSTVLPVLAYHWERAEEYEKAVRCLDAAGEQSLDRYANREATELLEHALQLAADHPEAVQLEPTRVAVWHRNLAEALFRLGNLEGCRHHGKTALALMGWRVPNRTTATLLDLGRQVLVRLSSAVLTPKQAAAPDQQRRLTAARVLNRLTEINIYEENAMGAVAAGLRELNTVEPAGPSPELGKAFAVMAVLLGAAPPLRSVAERWAVKAVSITEGAAGLAAPLSYVLCRVAIVDLYACRWESAVERLERALEVARRCGDRRLLEEVQGVFLLVRFFAGQLPQTLPMLESMRSTATTSANAQIVAWSHLGFAGTYIRQGRYLEAMAELEQCNEWVETKGSNSEVLWKRGLAALAQSRLPHHSEQALATADSALPLIGWPVAYWMQHALAAIAEVYIRALRETDRQSTAHSELVDKAQLALRGVQRFGLLFPFGQGHALLWRAELALALGDQPRGVRLLRECVSFCTANRLRWELALAQRSLILHLAPDDPGVPAMVVAAVDAFAQMGAPHERDGLLALPHVRRLLGLAPLPAA